MNVAYDPAVRRDVRIILGHYDEISIRLGDEFWDELQVLIDQARINPEPGAGDGWGALRFQSGSQGSRA